MPAFLAIALSLLAATHGPAVPNVNPAITINVDAAANRHPIDPRIYGVAWADDATLADLDITINRWGGNAMSRYNWSISTANRCKDFYFENIPDSVAGDGSNGESADDFIGTSFAHGAQTLMTVPMMGMLPKDRTVRCGYSIAKYGAQDDSDQITPLPDCGNGKSADVRLKHVNDPADTSAVYPSSHQGDWIQHLVDTWGAASAGGVKYYALDNEPSLWSFDHWDVHPDGSTYDEVWADMQEYGAAIKAKDPTALITGIEEWGWSGYFSSGLDQENGNNGDQDAHGGIPYAEWLLQQAHAYQVAHGVRILDFAAVHFYPQGGEFSDDTTSATQLLRNRSTRSLWDPNYVDESWIGGTGIDGGHVRLIPRLKEWVANDDPGTKIAITEYNWGAENHINGGTAQADILGILGREAVDLAVRWTSPPSGSVVYNAFKMYRNYDGSHSDFGDQSVSAAAPNVDDVSAFAALRSSDHALTIMIVAKTLSGDTPVTVSLANFLPSGGAAHRWQLDSGNAITHPADVALSGSTIPLTVPAQSITLLVVPGSYLDPPAGVSAMATSISNVNVTWTAAAGATGYQVYRSSQNAAFTFAGSTAGTSFPDGGRAQDTTYLYKVLSVSGSAASPLSSVDAATTTAFTDASLTAGMAAKAVHITQLRTAVNAMRAAAGLGSQAFTDPGLAAGTTIRALHVTELRTALDQARAAIGLPALTHTDATITPNVTPLKSAHIVDLRNGVK